jgi:WD40 repeat protein
MLQLEPACRQISDSALMRYFCVPKNSVLENTNSCKLFLLQPSLRLQVFTGHSGPVRCGRFTPDGKSVVTGGGEGDESLKVWDPRNGACTLSVNDAHLFHSAGEEQA